MKLSILPILLLAGLSSCAATTQDTAMATELAPGAAPAEDSAPDKKAKKEKKKDPKELAQEVADLEHKVQIAQIKVRIATLTADGADVEFGQKRARAELALNSAKANLAYFNTVEAPNRTGRAELSLQGALDQAKEAQEELEQLAIMYDDQNLEEMTSEFVIQRGKRRADRANKRIEFSKLDLRGLTQHKLKQERQSLESAVLKAQQGLEALDREAQKNKLNRTLKLSEANYALKKAEESLKKAQEKLEEGDDA